MSTSPQKFKRTIFCLCLSQIKAKVHELFTLLRDRELQQYPACQVRAANAQPKFPLPFEIF
jgi:hypothetical protein